MRLNPGCKLQNGTYTIEKELRSGRFSISYLAHKADGERWAIKVLDAGVLATVKGAERDRVESLFWQEATKLAKCSGTPHIMRTQMPFKEGPMTFFPVEYLDGNSLGDRAQPILLEATALSYIRQIGKALSLVHSKQLVHRDIRPSNILLRIYTGRVEAVLTNFSLATDCDTTLSLARCDELIDGFSPIELYSSGKAVGPYTDVYALAATLYQLLTGEMPTSAQDRMNGKALVSPQVKNPEISGKTAKGIMAGLELLPEKRPQSVADWLKKLDIKLQLTPGSATHQFSENTTTSETVNWAKWQTIWAIIAVVVTLLVSIPAWFAWNEPTTPHRSLSKPSLEPPSQDIL